MGKPAWYCGWGVKSACSALSREGRRARAQAEKVGSALCRWLPLFLTLWLLLPLTPLAGAATAPHPWTNLFAPLPQAQQALLEWRWEEALSLFQQALEGEEPFLARLGRLGLGLCQQALGQKEEALLLWEGLTGEADWVGAQAHYLLAWEALAVGEAEAAWEHLRAGVRLNVVPDRIVVLLRGLGAWGFWPPEEGEASPLAPYRWLLVETDLMSPYPATGIEEAERLLRGKGWGVRVVGWAGLGEGLKGYAWEEAEVAYRRAAEAAKEVGEVCLLAEEALGRAGLTAGAAEEAVGHLATFVHEGSKVVWPVGVNHRFRLAERYYERKRWREALLEYRAVLGVMGPEHHKYVAALLHYGMSAKGLGRWEEAAPALKEVAETAENPQVAVYAALRYAEVEAARGREEAAVAFLRGMAEEGFLTSAQASLLLLRAAYWSHELRRYEESISICRKVLERYPEEREVGAGAWLRMAYCYEYAGQLEAAREAFERVIREYADFPRLVAVAKADLAFAVLSREGKVEEALRLTREALREVEPESPEFITLQYRVGSFLTRLGRYEEALAALEKVPPGRGSDPHLNVPERVVNRRVECLVHLGRWEEAKRVLQEAKERFAAHKWEQQLALVQRWQKRPIQVSPAKVFLEVVHPGAEAQAEVRVRTYKRLPLAAEVDLPFLRTRVEEVKGPERGSWLVGFPYRVVLEVSGEVKKGEYEGVLRVRGGGEGYVLEVPVEVRVRGWVQVQPSQAFFGFISVGEEKEVELRLVGKRAFGIKAVNGAATGMEVEVEGEGKEYFLKVRWRPEEGQRGKTVEGTLQVETDVEGEEVIKIGYFGYVQPSLGR